MQVNKKLFSLIEEYNNKFSRKLSSLENEYFIINYAHEMQLKPDAQNLAGLEKHLISEFKLGQDRTPAIEKIKVFLNKSNPKAVEYLRRIEDYFASGIGDYDPHYSSYTYSSSIEDELFESVINRFKDKHDNLGELIIRAVNYTAKESLSVENRIGLKLLCDAINNNRFDYVTRALEFTPYKNTKQLLKVINKAMHRNNLNYFESKFYGSSNYPLRAFAAGFVVSGGLSLIFHDLLALGIGLTGFGVGEGVYLLKVANDIHKRSLSRKDKKIIKQKLKI